MMGRTHALTGWCAGLAVAPLVGAGQIHEAVAMATTTAGFALLPDLDHPGARASRLLGPLTGGLSWLLRRASATLYALTRRAADDNSTGTHRHMTHTLAFAGALGAATTIGTQAGGIYAVAAVAILGLLLAENALGDWLLPAAGAAIAWWAYTSPSGLSELAQLSGWLGIAVALGCVVHCLGDAVTESGCPFLWPIPIRGQTWYELRPPSLATLPHRQNRRERPHRPRHGHPRHRPPAWHHRPRHPRHQQHRGDALNAPTPRVAGLSVASLPLSGEQPPENQPARSELSQKARPRNGDCLPPATFNIYRTGGLAARPG